MKTKWNLKMLYRSPKDPHIEKDIEKIEKATKSFVKKYRNNNNYLKSSTKLLEALTDYENLYEQLMSEKPFIYFYLKKYIDSSNAKTEARINKLHDVYTRLENEIIFFDLSLGKIPEDLQKKHLNSNKLSHYRYFLKLVFERAKFDLDEKEEKILSLKSLPSSSLWTRGMNKLANKQTVKFKGKDRPLSEAGELCRELPLKKRHSLHKRYMKKLYEISDFAESEINAVFIDKKINDELRGYSKPYSSRLLANDNTEEELNCLVDTVSKHIGLSHRFYKTKAKLLGVKRLESSDISAKVGKIKTKYKFSKTLEILRKIYSEMDPGFIDILDSFVEKGQFDVYPRKNKDGGGFCLSSINNPTFILMNYVDGTESARTVAHEMGHAIHAELSRQQSPLYQSCPMCLAETTSSFFEDLMFDHIIDDLDGEEKVSILQDKIHLEISIIFSCIMSYKFELELHEKVREQGFVSKEEIAKLRVEYMREYLGDIYKENELDGYSFVNYHHLRLDFYIYSYAYGKLVSRAMGSRYKRDKSYIKEIEKFLSAGGSKNPHDILKEIGIDTYDLNFWTEGLKSVEADIEMLQELTKCVK